jgi:hypothetical protein
MRKYRLKIKLNTIFLELLLYSPFILLSQIKLNEENVSVPFISTTDKIFSKLDMEKIPSGILLDKTPVLSNFSLYSGTNPEVYISSDTLLQLYSELYYAHFEKEGLDDVFSFQEKAKKFSKINKNTIPIGLLFFDYQKLLPEAVNNGDFVMLDGFAIDKTGVGETPYSNETVFAMAPLLNVNSTEKAIHLILDESFINNNKSYIKIQIKTTENGNWEDIELGEIISLKNNLLKEDIIINFRVFAKGEIFYCSSIIPKINKEGKIDVIPPDDIIDFSTDNVMPENLFLQDRTIQYDADFEALNEIKAGKNVTDLLFSHDFVVSGNADVSFIASNKISLEPGFSTLSGAHFDARIEDVSCSKKIDSKQNSNNGSGYFSEKGIDFLKSIVEESEKTDIVFPNPSEGIFNVQIGDFASNKLKVEVVNMSGNIIYSNFNKGSSSLSINISDQPSGVYFVKLITNTEQRTYKIFKQ